MYFLFLIFIDMQAICFTPPDNVLQQQSYRNKFNKRAPEILAQLFGEFAVATATALLVQRDIFRDRVRHIRRQSCHGGLQGGALGHSA